MAYSKQVVERFQSVLDNPQKHSVGRFDPKDPNVACLLYTSDAADE